MPTCNVHKKIKVNLLMNLITFGHKVKDFGLFIVLIAHYGLKNNSCLFLE